MSGNLIGQVGVGWGAQGRALDRVGLAAEGVRAGHGGVAALVDGEKASGLVASREGDASIPGGFGGALDEALRRVDVPKAGSGEQDALYEKIHGMAEELVSGAFVRPVLAKMRETNQAAPPFAPGLYEKTFGPLLDTEISQQIVRSSKFLLVDAMTDQLMAKVRRGAGREAGHG